MTFAYVAERGHAAAQAASANTYTLTVASNATAGAPLILVFGSRQTPTRGASTRTDTKGNTWVTAATPAANNGKNNYVFIAYTNQTAGTLTTSDTIIVTPPNATTENAAFWLEEFSGGPIGGKE